MFDLMIFTFITAFWVSLIGGTLVLFFMRLYMSLQYKLDVKQILFVLFTPCSIGVYKTIKNHNQLTIIYRVFVVIFFLATLVASILILYNNLELDII